MPEVVSHMHREAEKAAPKALPSRNCEHVHAETANTPWWSWGESKHRNLSGTSVWAASARGFNDVCLTGRSVSVWWCAFCAMKCATRRAGQKGLVLEDHIGGLVSQNTAAAGSTEG